MTHYPRPCPWCADPSSTEDAPEILCRTHRAEYAGLTLEELDRSERETAAEVAEWLEPEERGAYLRPDEVTR